MVIPYTTWLVGFDPYPSQFGGLQSITSWISWIPWIPWSPTDGSPRWPAYHPRCWKLATVPEDRGNVAPNMPDTLGKWLENRRKKEIARLISHLVAIRFLMGWSNPDEYQRSYRFELEWDHPNLQNHNRSTDKLVVFSDLQADSIKILSFWVKSCVGPFSWCQIIYVKNWKWCLSFLVSPKYDQKPSKNHLYSFNIFMYLLLEYISIYGLSVYFSYISLVGGFNPSEKYESQLGW